MFLGCVAALTVFCGPGRGVSNKSGQLDFWLQINQRSKSQPAGDGQRKQVHSALERLIISSGTLLP